MTPPRLRAGALAALLTVAATAPMAQESPDGLAKRIQARYDTVRDFTADFEQTYVGGALRARVVESGTMQLQKPGRMRWEYRTPEKKLFVADGRRSYVYVPADKQVVVADLPAGDRSSTPILFLAGRGNLVLDFTAEYATVAGAPADTTALRLTPTRAESDYETITLVVDRDSLRIRMFVATDAQGGSSTFVFRNLRENVDLPERSFTFTIPKGVDVVSQFD